MPFIDLVKNRKIIIVGYKTILRYCCRMGWSPKYGVSLQAPFGKPYKFMWHVNDCEEITSGYVKDHIKHKDLHTLLYKVKHNCYQGDPEDVDDIFKVIKELGSWGGHKSGSVDITNDK
jgi:hypothetical protein